MTQINALLLTLLVEAPVAAAAGAALGKRGAREIGRMMCIAIAGSLVTHPIAWWTNRLLMTSLSFGLRALVIEVGVALVEGLLFAWLARLKPLQGLAVGALTNGASFGVGLVVYFWR